MMPDALEERLGGLAPQVDGDLALVAFHRRRRAAIRRRRVALAIPLLLVVGLAAGVVALTAGDDREPVVSDQPDAEQQPEPGPQPAEDPQDEGPESPEITAAPPELAPGQAKEAASLVESFLVHLQAGESDQAADLLGEYALLADPAGEEALARLRSDHAWLATEPVLVTSVTPAWTWRDPVPVVTVTSEPDGDGPRRVAAFLVTGAGAHAVRIERLPGGEDPPVEPAPGSPVGPGDRIELSYPAVEGGVRVHVDGREVPVDADDSDPSRGVSFMMPDWIEGDAVVTLSAATPEMPAVHALWFPTGS
jgi:hypothetical protein